MESINQITKELATEKGLTVCYESETVSTNLKAKELGKTNDLYLTDHQTQGRGRGSAHWHDTASGTCLLSSWTFQLNQPPQPIASPLFGVALYMALKNIWPNGDFSLKAPNDIYLGDKKLAGLLIEATSTGANTLLVVGLGINIFDHPKEVTVATHLTTGVKFTAEAWSKFLDVLITYFNEMAVLSTANEMPAPICHQLQMALNLNPNIEDLVSEVDRRGNIITKNGVIRWFDL